MRHTNPDHLRAFEQRVADEFGKGTLPFLVHLSGGNEDWLAAFFAEHVREGDWVLSTHRNHFHYLLAGGSEESLMAKIKSGRSMFVFDAKRRFLSSSILGGLVGVAAGLAYELAHPGLIECAPSAKALGVTHGFASPWNHVWCFLGDGAEDNGHLYEAALWAAGRRLPVTFIIEDNDRSVDVAVEKRTGGVRLDWSSLGNVIRHHYTPTWPHAGAGLKTMVEFDPAIVRQHTMAALSK